MTSISHKIVTEVPSSYMQTLLDFIYVQYLFPQDKKFSRFSRKIIDGIPTLSYAVLNEQNRQPILDVAIKAANPIEINLQSIDSEVPSKIIELAKQDVIIAVQMFEEKTRKRALYFAWRAGEKIIPETIRKKEKSFKRLFLETQILFFVVFITIGSIIFILISTFYPDAFWFAPIVLILVHSLLPVFYFRYYEFFFIFYEMVGPSSV